MTAAPKIAALTPWFGANRMGAESVGEELGPLDWCGVMFAGSMSELPFIDCIAVVVNDKHRHVINLAKVIADPLLSARLEAELELLPFHPEVLRHAQAACRMFEETPLPADSLGEWELGWAKQFFIAGWMNRSACAGTKNEFSGSLPVRWSATGGDSNVRYRSAVESIAAWHEQMRRCNFAMLDWREFLTSVKDQIGHGLYADPPFPGPGDQYKYTFTEADHRELAKTLAAFKNLRVVCRFYDCPLVRELYPKTRWTWRELNGRDQHNAKDKLEVLILNGPSYATQKGLF